MVLAQKFIISKRFKGDIKDDDLVLVEEELSPIRPGEFLVEALYLSVDPYMRAYAQLRELGSTMIGGQVGKVTESHNAQFPVGSIVVGAMGWRTHTIISDPSVYDLYKLPDIGDLPVSLAVGALGMPGNTALFGFVDSCKPKFGETVLITGAAGAVGNHVGQIAKIKGCKVIGIAGSEEKGRWLKGLGFDHVINYKTSKDVVEDIKQAAPHGIDCFFENVGGLLGNQIMTLMRHHGRVAVCGLISSYQKDNFIEEGPSFRMSVLSKSLTVTGFRSADFKDRWFEGIQQNLEWIREKKLKYRESVTEDFANAPKALRGLFKGENIGKAVVRVRASRVDTQAVDFHGALHAFNSLQVQHHNKSK